MLQQEARSIITDPRKYMSLIHGVAGCGKTTLASQIENHYFALTEQGDTGVEVFGESISSWTEFLSLVNNLKAGKEKDWKEQREVKILIIDTIENLYDFCSEWICTNETFLVKGVPKRYKNIEDVTYGKGFGRVNALLLKIMQKIRALDIGILMLSHSKEKSFQWAGQDLHKTVPNLYPSAILGIVGACDVVGCFTIEEEVIKREGKPVKVENERCIYFQPTFLREAKHRLEGFPEKLVIPLRSGWQVYLAAFQKAVEEWKKQK